MKPTSRELLAQAAALASSSPFNTMLPWYCDRPLPSYFPLLLPSHTTGLIRRMPCGSLPTATGKREPANLGFLPHPFVVPSF